jgi:hypothetical protein
MRFPLLLTAVLSTIAVGCPSSSVPPPPPAPDADPLANGGPGGSPGTKADHYGRVDRATFNRVAARLDAPVYWSRDADNDGSIDPDETASLLFFSSSPVYVESGKFTPAFESVYSEIEAAAKAPAPTGADAARIALIQQELDDAASVLVETDLSKASADEKKFVRNMLETAALLDQLYAIQSGAGKEKSKVAPDRASQSLYRRNWGTRCLTPKLEKDPACTAAPGAAKQTVDVYPEAMQKDDGFCKTLEKDKASKELLAPFTVVREKDKKLVAVPYTEAYGPPMKAIAAKLRTSAKELADPNEGPMRAYLEAAATAFETNDWKPADEAWAKMNARNSKFYLRIGPDETYWEPCSQKAGFHVSFARINKDSLALQDKLTPHQQMMEDELAKLIGEPYKARKVTFHLPDFIDIVLNAGDSRDPIGGTIGQSLPNWGPVANEGRGRTVAMTNLYTDPDSMAVRKAKAASLLAPETMQKFGDEPGPGLMSTVLHEAAHNLGPSHEYKYKGKKDDEAFGGEHAAMLEELKAQSGAYYYLYLLRDKGVFDDATVERTIVDNVVWALNHISRGMVTASGKRKAYSQLSAIQIGFFMSEGAITWDPKAKAANGTDVGAFKIDFSKMRDASLKLMKTVGHIKAANDKKTALELDKHVDIKTAAVPHAAVTERMLKFPQPNFVYAIDWQ